MSKQPEGTPVDGLKLPISRLVLGTMTFGDTVDEATAGRMVDEALDAGITTIDTANAYVGRRHRGDARRLLKDRRDRRHPRLQGRHAAPGPRRSTRRCPRRGCAPASRAACAGSAPTASTCSTCTSRTGPRPLHETLRHRGRARRRRARSAPWACPTSPPGRSPTSSTRRREVGAPRPVVAQQLYNLVARRRGGGIPRIRRHAPRAHHGLQPARRRPAHRQAQLRRQAHRGPLRRLQARRHVHRSATGTSSCSTPSTRCPASPRDAGITLAELSLRWLAYRDGVGSMLLGGSKVEQLRANIAAVANGPAAGRRRRRLRRRRRRRSAAPCPPTTADPLDPTPTRLNPTN